MTPPAVRRRVPGDDRGVTLVEVMIAMTLMSIFMVLFTTGLLQVFRASDHDQAAAAAQEQIHIAFQRLDSGIRYAAGISAEGQVGADWYVEFLATYTGTPVCTELRFTQGGQLQSRTWDQGATPPSFTVLASGATASHPFTRYPVVVGSGIDYQRLSVDLSVSGGRDAGSRDISVMFTAYNTSPTTASDTSCVEGRTAP
jgi:prepilin-type N-terminal cleavage/methylation domain-containing protein